MMAYSLASQTMSIQASYPIPAQEPCLFRNKFDAAAASCLSGVLVLAATPTIVHSRQQEKLPSQDGIFALNLFVRVASVVNHLLCKSVPVRNRSIQAGGSTEKSILWRPQSGRRPS